MSDTTATPDMGMSNYSPVTGTYRSYETQDDFEDDGAPQSDAFDYSLANTATPSMRALPSPPALPRTSTATPGRSRARALSFLSSVGMDSPPFTSHKLKGEFSASGADGSYGDDGDESEAAFSGGAYDFALRPEEDDEEDEDIRTSTRGIGSEPSSRRRQRKSSFQRLAVSELWWMAGSAALVFGLTATAVILSVIG